MTVVIAIVVALVALAAGVAIGYWLPPHGRRPARDDRVAVRRILLPFTGRAISRRAFEAAARLAKAENATIIPAFLARVPRTLPIDSPLPAQCDGAMALIEALEQRANAEGIAVDARIARGRTYRDALRRLLEEEQFDRVIVSASESSANGLSPDDLEWLLDRVPAEVMILRPAPDDKRHISVNGVHGHF
jgi:nucleotide-binding universal stress UspA family protein